MTDEIERRDEDDARAAEYALRLLDGEELRAAQERMRTDPAFRRMVLDWEARLAPLAADLAPETPSRSSKPDLMTRLFPEAAKPSFWERAGIWRGFSLAALALAALLGWLLLGAPEPQRGPLYAATIASESGDFRVVALVDKRRNEVTMTRTEGAAPTGRILQVWAHGPGEPAQSVGLWPEGETVRLPLPPEIAAVEGVLTLGVSEEPPGGSPTGSPSGRVFGTVDIPSVRSDL